MRAVYACLATVCALGVTLAPPAAAERVEVHYRFELSDFSGTLPYSGGRLVADEERNEVYVIAGNTVRVFNEAGMETYSFRGAPDLGPVGDLTLDAAGDILLLSHDPAAPGGYRVTQCNYRGEPKREIVLTGLPAEFAAFHPDRIFSRARGLYLVSRAQRWVVVAAPDGSVRETRDLSALIDTTDKRKKTSGAEIVGFNVDRKGKLLFTVPTLFLAFVVSPDGNAVSFGQPGSATGKFSVVDGIAADDRGHYFVADKGRSLVLVFGEDLGFVTEFGSSRDERSSLLRPGEVAWDDSGRLYVTQMGNRGVAAFSVSFE